MAHLFIVWYQTFRCADSIYICELELLMSMPECKLVVLSWCILASLRSCASIDIPVCSNRLTRLCTIRGEQLNILTGRITLGTVGCVNSLLTPILTDT